MTVRPELRAALSQAMAEGAEWSDMFIDKYRERIEAIGEAEATAELYASLIVIAYADRAKLVNAVLCLAARLARVEVPS